MKWIKIYNRTKESWLTIVWALSDVLIPLVHVHHMTIPYALVQMLMVSPFMLEKKSHVTPRFRKENEKFCLFSRYLRYALWSNVSPNVTVWLCGIHHRDKPPTCRNPSIMKKKTMYPRINKNTLFTHKKRENIYIERRNV